MGRREVMRRAILILTVVALIGCAEQPKAVHRNPAAAGPVVQRPVTYAPIRMSDRQLEALEIQALDSADADIRAHRARRQAEEDSEALRETIETQKSRTPITDRIHADDQQDEIDSLRSKLNDLENWHPELF